MSSLQTPSPKHLTSGTQTQTLKTLRMSKSVREAGPGFPPPMALPLRIPARANTLNPPPATLEAESYLGLCVKPVLVFVHPWLSFFIFLHEHRPYNYRPLSYNTSKCPSKILIYSLTHNPHWSLNPEGLQIWTSNRTLNIESQPEPQS